MEPEVEVASPSQFALEIELAPHQANEPRADGEAETRSAEASGRARVGLREALEDGRELFRLPHELAPGFVAWSPDGKHIAYISDASGEDEIWVVDQGGKTIVPAGQAMSDEQLNQMNYYLQGVVSKIPN